MKAIVLFFALLISLLTIVDLIITTISMLDRRIIFSYDGIKRALWITVVSGLWSWFYWLTQI